MPSRAGSIKIEIKPGALRNAIAEIGAELEARDDVFDQMNDQEVSRRLIAYAITEHRAGRGPWPKTTR